VIKFCAWLGPLFTLMWLVGAGPVSNWTYILPPSAANTSAQTLQSYLDNLVAIRIGCVFMIFSCALYTGWNMAISMVARKMEGDRPILFYIQVISVAASVVVVMFIGFFWGVAAFRAGETTAEVTQALNDLGWFGVLFTGAPFFAYQVALAAQILRSENPVFPRWVAFYNILVSLFMFEACFIIFFKSGPFSQNGALVFYAPMIMFFVWICTMSVLLLRAVKAEQTALPAARTTPVTDRLTASA
jgi:glucan phosphoethanolaminetransferase (alkaline phosphatase superfamily)